MRCSCLETFQTLGIPNIHVLGPVAHIKGLRAAGATFLLYFSLIVWPANIPGSQRNHAVLLNFRWEMDVWSSATASQWRGVWQKNWVKRTRKKKVSAQFITAWADQTRPTGTGQRELLCPDINMLHTQRAGTLQLLCVHALRSLPLVWKQAATDEVSHHAKGRSLLGVGGHRKSSGLKTTALCPRLVWNLLLCVVQVPDSSVC